MGLKSKERDHLLIRQLKLTANEPVIAKSLGYGIAHFCQELNIHIWQKTKPSPLKFHSFPNFHRLQADFCLFLVYSFLFGYF